MSNSSTMQQPLNQAIVHQVLHDLRNGQIRRCKAMGLGDEILKAFEKDKFISVLLNAKISWCNVSINEDIVRRLLNQVDRADEEARLIDRALRLGASSGLITQLFGMTNGEIAYRRQVLDVPSRKGRWPVLDEATEHALWDRWTFLSAEYRVDIEDAMAVLDVVILMAEEYANLPLADGSVVSLSQIWTLIQSWADQELI